MTDLESRAQKHPERPDGGRLKLVRSQKSGSRPTEVKDNCGRPITPKGKKGLHDDDDDDDLIVLKKISHENSPEKNLVPPTGLENNNINPNS